MRYLKVIILVLFFFVSMIFFFQNQATLSTEMTLNLHLFFLDPMKSISLPFYFLVLAAFFVGAILAVMALIWDKMSISARLMKATWRVRSLEKEVASLRATQAKALPVTPKETKETTETQKEDKKQDDTKDKTVDVKAENAADDITAPDPNKGA